MTTPESSTWHSFDPSDGSGSESLPAPPSDVEHGGGIVAIVAASSVAHAAWASSTAVAVARRWADSGARVMLADLGLSNPSLHESVGVENGEGMSDVFLYGASIQRIAYPAHEGAFFFAPAGTVVAGSDAVLTHSRWQSLEKGFGSAGALLLLYAPATQDGLGTILDRAESAVVLGTEGDAAAEILGGASVELLGALAPAEPLEEGDADLDFRVDDVEEDLPPLVAGDGAGTKLEAQDEAAVEAPATDGGEAMPEAPGEGVAATDDAPAADLDASDEAAVESAADEGRAVAAPSGRSRRTLWIFLLMLLVVAGALAAAWFGWVEIPGLEGILPTAPSGDPTG